MSTTTTNTTTTKREAMIEDDPEETIADIRAEQSRADHREQQKDFDKCVTWFKVIENAVGSLPTIYDADILAQLVASQKAIKAAIEENNFAPF